MMYKFVNRDVPRSWISGTIGGSGTIVIDEFGLRINRAGMEVLYWPPPLKYENPDNEVLQRFSGLVERR